MVVDRLVNYIRVLTLLEHKVNALPSAVTSPGGGFGAPYQTDGGAGGSGGGVTDQPTGRSVAAGSGDLDTPEELMEDRAIQMVGVMMERWNTKRCWSTNTWWWRWCWWCR